MEAVSPPGGDPPQNARPNDAPLLGAPDQVLRDIATGCWRIELSVGLLFAACVVMVFGAVGVNVALRGVNVSYLTIGVTTFAAAWIVSAIMLLGVLGWRRVVRAERMTTFDLGIRTLILVTLGVTLGYVVYYPLSTAINMVDTAFENRGESPPRWLSSANIATIGFEMLFALAFLVRYIAGLTLLARISVRLGEPRIRAGLNRLKWISTLVLVLSSLMGSALIVVYTMDEDSGAKVGAGCGLMVCALAALVCLLWYVRGLDSVRTACLKRLKSREHASSGGA